jgi:hypothetical protein
VEDMQLHDILLSSKVLGGGSGGTGWDGIQNGESYVILTSVDESMPTANNKISTIANVNLFFKGTEIPPNGFMRCDNILTVKTDSFVGYIYDNTFYDCKNLTTVDCDAVISIGGNAFEGCSALSTAIFPTVTTILPSAFFGCISLTTIKLPKVTSIGDSAFRDCINLSAVIIGTTSKVCEIEFTSLLGTKIMTEEGLPTGEGFIYIPARMFDSYRAAYEPVFDQIGASGLFDILFRKIEDYPEICE